VVAERRTAVGVNFELVRICRLLKQKYKSLYTGLIVDKYVSNKTSMGALSLFARDKRK